jgi:hypothetical protein
MQTATLKRVTEKLGISPEDLVFYRTLGNKAFIEIDLKLPALGTADNSEPDVFDNILAMSEELGIKDWALNHDHYLYGAPKRKDEKPDA